jgi:hypothetical protein
MLNCNEIQKENNNTNRIIINSNFKADEIFATGMNKINAVQHEVDNQFGNQNT